MHMCSCMCKCNLCPMLWLHALGSISFCYMQKEAFLLTSGRVPLDLHFVLCVLRVSSSSQLFAPRMAFDLNKCGKRRGPGRKRREEKTPKKRKPTPPDAETPEKLSSDIVSDSQSHSESDCSESHEEQDSEEVEDSEGQEEEEEDVEDSDSEEEAEKKMKKILKMEKKMKKMKKILKKKMKKKMKKMKKHKST